MINNDLESVFYEEVNAGKKAQVHTLRFNNATYGSTSFLYQNAESDNNFIIRVQKSDKTENYRYYGFGYDKLKINERTVIPLGSVFCSVSNIEVAYNSTTNDYRGFITEFRSNVDYGTFIAAFPVFSSGSTTVSGPFTLYYQSGGIYVICNSAQTISNIRMNILYNIQ